MDSAELCYLPATDALESFRNRRLSPVELLKVLVARAEATEATLNAFTERFFDEALDQARQAERRYGGGSEDPRPLEGLAVAVKDEAEIAGKRTTQGSLLLGDHVGEEERRSDALRSSTPD